MAAAAADPGAIYSRARKLVGFLEYQLQQLEEGTAGSAVTEEEARSSTTENLNLLFQEVAALDRAIADRSDAKREIWHKRSAQLTAEAGALRSSVVRYFNTTFASRKAARERAALLGGAGVGADAVAVDAFLAERASLTSSAAMMDDITATADSVMGALRGQRGMLKGVHKRVLDMGAALGVSTSLMRLIERRNVGDKILVYGGSAVILLLILLVWWATR